MGVLDSVLAYKAKKDAEARADIDAIPAGINAFVAAKQQAQKSLLDQMTYNMQLQKFNLDAQKQPYEIAKLQGEASKVPFETQKIQAETKKTNSESAALDSFLGNGQSNSNVQAAEATIGGIKYVKPEVLKQQEQLKNDMALDLERQKDALKGAGADSGRVALAKESLKNIEDIKSILFPDGTPKSFDRKVAFGSNVPGSQFPILGHVIPDVIPFGEKGQDVARKMGASLSARQLIQTGVAARPEETAKLVSQFAPQWSTNPKSAMDGLNELSDFYKSYLNEVDPQGAKGVNKPSSSESKNNTPEIKVPEGLTLPKGHKIIAVRQSNGK